ncbi:PPD7 [Symbiodinium sp. CCMP2592]|nr:PPD7 [Symbiodinium sp. CCMP2592]
MDPGMPPDLLALSTCLDATHGASEVAQQLRILSAQRGSAGRFHSEVAECLMRMKEIDGIAKVEQCRLSESGLTERSRIVEEARSQRYKHLVDVMQVSVKEDAETARQEISARAEVSKETVKGNVQIQESQARVEKSSSNFWQWVALTLLGSSILTGRRRGSFRRGAGRLLGWLPWLLLALLGWRQTRATRFHLSQLMMLTRVVRPQRIRSPPLRRFLGLGSFFGGGAVTDTTESPEFTPASPLASASSEQSAPSMPRRPSRQDVDAATASERDSPIKGSASSVPGSEEASLSGTIYLPVAQEGEAAAALRRFLKPAGLDVYTDRLLAEGYDFEALTMLEGTEREEMLRIVQCLPGHKVKFRKLLWRSQS